MTSEAREVMEYFAKKKALKAEYGKSIKLLKDELASKIKLINVNIDAIYSYEIDRVMELLMIPLNYISYNRIMRKRLRDIVDDVLRYQITEFVYLVGYCQTHQVSEEVIRNRPMICRNDIGIARIEFIEESNEECIITFSVNGISALRFTRSTLTNPETFNSVMAIIKSVKEPRDEKV